MRSKPTLPLRDIRKLRKMSVETLAGKVRVSSQTIKNWETGRVSLAKASFEKILLLTEALEMNLPEMLPVVGWDSSSD